MEYTQCTIYNVYNSKVIDSHEGSHKYKCEIHFV